MHGFRSRHAVSVCCSILLCVTASTTLKARAQMPEPQLASQSVVRSTAQSSPSVTNLTQNRRALKGALSLPQAIELTLRHNPELSAFAFKQQAAQLEQQQAQLKPAMAASLEVENVAGNNDHEGTKQAEVTLALSSVIELGNKRQARTALAQEGFAALQSQQDIVTLDTLARLTQTFVSAIASHASLALMQEKQSLLQALVADSQQRARRGALSELEVLRAEAALAQAQLSLEVLQTRFDQQTVALSLFWGADRFDFTGLQGSLFTTPKSLDVEALYQQLVNAPNMQWLASQERLENAQWQLAKAQQRTDLGWQIGLRRLEDSNSTAAVLGLSMPLGNRQRSQLQANQTRARHQAQALDRSQQRLRLQQQLITAHNTRQQHISALEHLQTEIIPRLEQALTIAVNDYQRGRLRFQDRITVQEELLQAKQQRIETAAAVLLNQSIIEQLTGQALTSLTAGQ